MFCFGYMFSLSRNKVKDLSAPWRNALYWWFDYWSVLHSSCQNSSQKNTTASNTEEQNAPIAPAINLIVSALPTRAKIETVRIEVSNNDMMAYIAVKFISMNDRSRDYSHCDIGALVWLQRRIQWRWRRNVNRYRRIITRVRALLKWKDRLHCSTLVHFHLSFVVALLQTLSFNIELIRIASNSFICKLCLKASFLLESLTNWTGKGTSGVSIT